MIGRGRHHGAGMGPRCWKVSDCEGTESIPGQKPCLHASIHLQGMLVDNEDVWSARVSQRSASMDLQYFCTAAQYR